MAYLDRTFGNSLYHYQRASGAEFFTTTATSGTNFNEGVANPINPIMEVVHREVVHVLSGNYIIVYDRFKTLPNFTLATTNAKVPWHTINNPTPQGDDLMFANSAGGRLWVQTLIKSAGATQIIRDNSDLTYSDTQGSLSFRKEWTLPLSSGIAYMLTLMMVTNTSTLITTAVAVPPSSGVPTDHTFRGLTINEAQYKHFLFSAQTDGSTPELIRYYVARNANTDIHRVFNLVPGQDYFVTETIVSGSNYRYDITPTFNSGFLANGAGVLEFRPVDIQTGGNFYTVNITDADAGVHSVSTADLQATYKIAIFDGSIGIGSESIVDIGSAVSNTYRVDIVDAAPSDQSVSTTGFTTRMTISDTGGTAVSTVLTDKSGVPTTTDTEKRIDGPIATLVPDGDLGVSFFVAEPGGGAFFEKVDDSDNDDFMRAIPSAVVQSSYALFTLSDNSGTVSTIRSIQFAVQVRSAQFTNVDAPFLRMDLFKGAPTDATRITLQDIPLFETENPMWFRSPVIPLVIEKGDIPNLAMGLRPRALTYGGHYGLEISSAFIDVSGDAPEKVI